MIDRELSHYRITAKLGSGGMGDVYRAEDTKLGRDVALKVLPAEMATHTDRLARFTREAKTVAGLNHPNIVTLYSVDEADGVHFLTMELVKGKTLDQLLPATGFPLGRIFELAIPIADAVASAHAQGVVHRDLKPGNVMVTDDGERVKVLDFGLAKLMSAASDETDLTRAETMTTTREGVVVGTPYYMSPEQARGGDVDPRSDIFAFGVMLYEMATGRRPFQGANSIEMLSSLLKDDPLPVTEIRSDLPRHLARVIRRCLEKDPNDRYQTTRDVLNELNALKLEVTSGFLRASSAGDAAGTPAGVSAEARRGRDDTPATRRNAARAVVFFAATLLLAAVATMLVVRNPFDRGAPQRQQTSDRRVVAVLPFENLGSAEDEYFADGITDEITSRLALIQDLGVISRTSARVYKGTDKSARQIGDELNADYILEGTIRWDRSGDRGRVRITPRLIQVTDDTQVWGDNFEREITEIFSVQADIASRIAGALDVTLKADEQRSLTAQPTDSIEAYEAYLKGMDQLAKPGFGRPSFELGIQMFERAVALDPDFALAWGRLSTMHSRMYHYGFDRSDGRIESARQAADRALALQPDLAEAHLALGQYFYWCERDYARALAAMDDARERNPNSSEIWLSMAYVKRRQGDLEAAIRLFEQDVELNPLDANASVGLGETYGTLRRYAEGEQAFQRAMGLAPDNPYPYTELALLYLRWRGDVTAARATLAGMPPVANSEACRVGFLVELLDRQYVAALERLDACPDAVLEAGIFATPTALFEGMTRSLMQDPQRARAAFAQSQAILEPRLASAPDDHRVHSALGLTYAGLGRTEEAVRHGRQAVALYPMSTDALQAPTLVIELALIYTMIGDEQAALEQLDAVLSIPSILSAPWLAKDPRWDPLRDNAGFAELLRKYAIDPGN